MKRNSKNSRQSVAGRELKSLKKVAGIRCPGKKRLAMRWPEHAPMGLNFFSRNESGSKHQRGGGPQRTDDRARPHEYDAGALEPLLCFRGSLSSKAKQWLERTCVILMRSGSVVVSLWPASSLVLASALIS